MRIDLALIARIADELDTLCGDDDRLFHDMLQGESDIDHIVRRIHEQLARDAEMIAGITERQAALAERKGRIQARYDGGKALIGKVMRAGLLTKLELPEVTYSVRDGKSGLIVLNDDAVPDEFCTLVRKPVKATINEAFADAKELPNWLSRSLPKDMVTARTR